MLAPNNNRGMTHQSDEKHLNYMAEYFVGVVKLAIIVLTLVFYDVSLTNNHLKDLYKSDIWKTHKMLHLQVFGHPGLHNTKNLRWLLVNDMW